MLLAGHPTSRALRQASVARQVALTQLEANNGPPLGGAAPPVDGPAKSCSS